MTPWWWLSVLTVALPVYVALRLTRSIWIAPAAFVAGFVLAAALEGMLSSLFNLMTGKAVAFADAIAHATQFPMKFLISVLLILAGALNPEPLFLLPLVVADILEGSGGNALRALKIFLQLFNLVATIVVPFVAAILGRPTVRWMVIGLGSLAVTAARIGAGYLHYKEQGIVVTIIGNNPPWLSAVHDINLAIDALVGTFIQICPAYLVLRCLVYLARKIWRPSTGSGSAGSPIAPTNVGTPPA
jgi:hypothetical protein